MSFQDFFKIRWAEFLKENFRTPEEIGVAFNVTSVTAQNWLDEATGPRGHNVARAFKKYPDEAAGLIKEDAAESAAPSKHGGQHEAYRAVRFAGGA